MTFAGKRADVPALLARATLACHAAHAEGLPNAVMEAMAARRPVVATAVGGVPDLLSHGTSGLLVPPRSPNLLADALLELLADPDRQATFGAAARERIEGHFRIEQLAVRNGPDFSGLTARA